MFPRFLLSVILIAGAASVAEAGVILNDEGLGQGLDIAGALAAMDNESGDPIVRNSAPEDGLTVSLQPSSGGSGSVPLHLPVHHSGLDVVPTERISLEDSILPPTPDLDGLIKPPQVVSV